MLLRKNREKYGQRKESGSFLEECDHCLTNGSTKSKLSPALSIDGQ